MTRKRLTQIMPWLTPLRQKQRQWCYFTKMKLEDTYYSECKMSPLEYTVASTSEDMINRNSGYDIQYQYNKAHNLKVAGACVHRIIIYPGEVFSLCYLLRNSKRYGKYRDGLVLVDGKIKPTKGGGLCQLSNILYYLFLQTPLTIVERHGHDSKSLPDSDPNALQGIDSTIASGWLDLKVANNTEDFYQVWIKTDKDKIYGKILCDKDSKYTYEIVNDEVYYTKENNQVYQHVSVSRNTIDKTSGALVCHTHLYDEKVAINYPIQEDTYEKESNSIVWRTL